MNISIEKAKQREDRIFWVEKALREINNKENKLLDYDKFCIEISEKFMCNLKTAGEYIKIAKSRIKDYLKE